MPIIRGTTPTIQVFFTKQEIPSLDDVKAFYLTYEQKGTRISDLSRRIYRSYTEFKTVLITGITTNAEREISFNFYTRNQNGKWNVKCDKFKTTLSGDIKYRDASTHEDITVYSGGEWADSKYQQFRVLHDDLDDYDATESQTSFSGISKTENSSMKWDAGELEETADGVVISHTLLQTHTNNLTADAELVGTADIIYNQRISGSVNGTTVLEYKRATSKTFADIVCDAERSGEVLNGES